MGCAADFKSLLDSLRHWEVNKQICRLRKKAVICRNTKLKLKSSRTLFVLTFKETIEMSKPLKVPFKTHNFL